MEKAGRGVDEEDGPACRRASGKSNVQDATSTGHLKEWLHLGSKGLPKDEQDLCHALHVSPDPEPPQEEAPAKE